MQNTLILLTLLAVLLLPSWLYAKDRLPQLSLAKHFKGQMQTSSYWVSEKLDGIRCYWNGKELKTRSGRTLNAPEWFIKGLPTQALDGELWTGRDGYQALTKIVLDKVPNDNLWQRVSYQVFDLPLNTSPFESRQIILKNIVKASNLPHLSVVKQTQMFDLEKIKTKLNAVIKQGGEGLMLRTPGSLYEGGRSKHLLKMKKRQDAEARVIAYQEGRGKFKNLMGAIWVEMPNGKLFKIGTGFSNVERQNPPPIGSDVTYSYQGYTKKGLPRFASFKRLKEKE